MSLAYSGGHTASSPCSPVLHFHSYVFVSVQQCFDAVLFEAHLRVQCMSSPIPPPRIGVALAGAIGARPSGYADAQHRFGFHLG